MEIVNAIVLWLRDSLALVSACLVSGTLYAWGKGTIGTVQWLAILTKAVLVGVAFGPVITSSKIKPEWHLAIIICLAFGAEYIFKILDSFWEKTSKDPVGTGRVVIRWLAGRSGVPINTNGK